MSGVSGSFAVAKWLRGCVRHCARLQVASEAQPDAEPSQSRSGRVRHCASCSRSSELPIFHYN